MRSRQAFNRMVFRGARVELRTRHHVKLRLGDRTTTMPMYGDRVPRSILRRIERDLGIDLSRPVPVARKATRSP